MASSADADVHEADLAQGMEHMRFYVSVPSHHQPKPPTVHHPTSIEDSLSQSNGASDVYGIPASAINPPRNTLTQRPTSPTLNPQKRSDPFQFGSRYLAEGDDIFEFNAWDHVEVDDAFKAFAEKQFMRQRESPASDYHRSVINTNPEKPWNRFYTNNAANFFKNRKWLFQEFPTLEAAMRAPAEGARNAVTILEIGAGAGNTAFPLLAANQNPDLKVHAVDFSTAAVDVMRKDTAYDGVQMQADVWDLAARDEGEEVCLPPDVKAGSVDVAVMVFVLSALEPTQWRQAMKNVWAALKPGGEVLFRDYGRGDLAQVRFKKGRWMGENFYVRGDGTRVYFFDEDELRKIWTGGFHESSSNETAAEDFGSGETSTKVDEVYNWPCFEVLNLGTDRRMLVNRQRKLKMYRCWMQGRFRKPLDCVR